MNAPYVVVPIADIDELIAAEMLEESEREGFRFVRRLLEEFTDGTNRFVGFGEGLFGVFDNGRLVAVAGLNRDPFARGNSEVGRVRRLYVLSAYRGQGIGRRLMITILAEARLHYRFLTLRTDTPQAAAFYAALGFKTPAPFPESTHYLALKPTEAV